MVSINSISRSEIIWHVCKRQNKNNNAVYRSTLYSVMQTKQVNFAIHSNICHRLQPHDTNTHNHWRCKIINMKNKKNPEKPLSFSSNLWNIRHTAGRLKRSIHLLHVRLSIQKLCLRPQILVLCRRVIDKNVQL